MFFFGVYRFVNSVLFGLGFVVLVHVFVQFLFDTSLDVCDFQRVSAHTRVMLLLGELPKI